MDPVPDDDVTEPPTRPTLQRTVYVRLPLGRYRELQELADEDLTTVSQVIRRLVCQGLDGLERPGRARRRLRDVG